MKADGPIPKRSTERRRRNKVEGETKVRVDGEVVIPPLPAGLHEGARDWYASLAQSGQSQFYEPSDWEYARICAGQLSVLLNDPKPTASLIAVVFNAMDATLHTEATRRRVRLEVERGQPTGEAPGVTAIAGYRERLEARN